LFITVISFIVKFEMNNIPTVRVKGKQKLRLLDETKQGKVWKGERGGNKCNTRTNTVLTTDNIGFEHIPSPNNMAKNGSIHYKHS
jgi:hypothetical protein